MGVGLYTEPKLKRVALLPCVKSHVVSCNHKFVECKGAEIWQEQNVSNKEILHTYKSLSHHFIVNN